MSPSATVALTQALLDRAAVLRPQLKPLDALHLATALALGDEVLVVVTTDLAMRRAAVALGLAVSSLPVDQASGARPGRGRR